MEQQSVNILQKWWFWLLMLLGGGIAVYFIVRPQRAQDKPKQYSWNNPDTGKTEIVLFSATPYTDAVYDAIYSYSWGFRNFTPYEDLLKLNDGQFAAVCQDWNNRKQREDKETLRVAVNNEWNLGDILPILNTRFNKLSII